MKKSIRLESLLLVALILIFLILEVSYIKLPGLYCDEASVGTFALHIKNDLSDSYAEEKVTENILVDFFTKRIPHLGQSAVLMRGFHGLLDSYILAVVFSVFPPGVVSMRLLAIFLGAATILLTYFFTKGLFDKSHALLAVFLLVINPSFIMGTKIGMDNGTIMITICMAVLFCLLKWFRSRKDIYFYLAVFFLGLGMWTRIWFTWFIAGLFLSAIMFRNDIKRRFEFNKSSRLFKYLILGSLMFCLGCLMIIYNEFFWRFATIKYVFVCLKNPTLNIGTHNNLHYFQNLFTVVNNFTQLLTGNLFFSAQFFIEGTGIVNTLYPWLLLFSIIFLTVLCILAKNFPHRKKVLFLLTIFIGMFLLTPISISQLPYYHFYFFIPLIQLIISAAIVSSFRYFAKFKILIIIIAVFSLTTIAGELNCLKGYFHYLKKTGGGLYYSPAIYDLTDYLIKEKTNYAVMVSWGLHNVIDVASGGKIQTKEAWYIIDFEPYLCKEDNLFVYFPKEISPDYNNVDRFFETAGKLKINLVEKKRFFDRGGRLIYVVMKMSKGPQLPID